MGDGGDYLAVNRANWDDRAPLHAASPGYRVEELVADPHALSHVVRFDRDRLGDIAGLDAVHLQCHIGTDTLSLARLGARMTGLDLSPASLAEARRLAERAGADIRYVESDVDHAVDVLEPGSFDLVYTGIGAICWLPSIDRWAATVSALLRPGGRLFMREGHPVLWSIDDEAGRLEIGFPYFETAEPTVWEQGTTYVETDRELTATRSMDWNHGIGEIVTALLQHGMELTGLVEHRSVPWMALEGQMVHDPETDEWSLAEHPERLPLSYTLQAVKRG
ncbi:class I SAM-dependent methyltransferase [Mesorhizobium japonicum]|uniref:class I SAM-dependent methyltransferase n=1 Tax=Mesorhizobium japonicum TaxID=2066070 RepID=UPI003B5C295D